MGLVFLTCLKKATDANLSCLVTVSRQITELTHPQQSGILTMRGQLMHRAGVMLGATENIRYIVMLLWARFAFLSYFKINIIKIVSPKK